MLPLMVLASGGGGDGSLLVDAIDWNVSSKQSYAGTLTGASDSKVGLLSCWVRLDGYDGASITALNNFDSNTGRIGINFKRHSDNSFLIVCVNTSASIILSMGSNTTYTTSATWLHVLAAWDLAAGTAQLYVNDIEDRSGSPVVTDDTIVYATTGALPGWHIAGSPGGNAGGNFNGGMAELYFAIEYLDISSQANRRKFITASGKPVNLGVDGSTPTGSQPLVYCTIASGGVAADFDNNAGAGEDFTQSGTPTIASTSPSD